MEIKLLYFDGCSSWKNALTNLQSALREEALDVSVHLIEVKSVQEASEAKFLGSPSFQIDGKDFWPEDRQSWSINCRLYGTSDGLKGWPTVEMLRLKLRNLIEDKDPKK